MYESGEIVTENIAKSFNSYFELITDFLKLFDWPLQSKISDNKVQNIVKIFSDHLSVVEIKQKFKSNKNFFLQCGFGSTVRKVMKNLSSDKATTGEFPVNVLKIVKFAFLN